MDNKAGIVLGFAGLLITLAPDIPLAILLPGLVSAVISAGLSLTAIWPRPHATLRPTPMRQYLTAENAVKSWAWRNTASTVDAVELAAIVVAEHQRHIGTGTALVEAVVDAVAAARARRLWLVTLNDNVDALCFYQRRGFHLAELHAGAVDAARNHKPSIPLIGNRGDPDPR